MCVRKLMGGVCGVGCSSGMWWYVVCVWLRWEYGEVVEALWCGWYM